MFIPSKSLKKVLQNNGSSNIYFCNKIANRETVLQLRYRLLPLIMQYSHSHYTVRPDKIHLKIINDFKYKYCKCKSQPGRVRMLYLNYQDR
jgi:hypothetical protein